MNDDLARQEYDALGELLQSLYTWEQWQWLSGDEKARLIQTETEPDHYDD